MVFDLCVLCTEESVNKTLGRALGANWVKARHTICHLEERQDVQFKSAGSRSVTRKAWAFFPWVTEEGDKRGCG